MKLKNQKFISLSVGEYENLKNKLNYFEEIKKAREDIKKGRTVPMEEIFKYLGI